MAKKIRIGVIGVGIGARVHIPGFQACPDAEVIAVCSARREHAEEAARSFGIPQIFTEYSQMLDLKDLDAVSIAAPPQFHTPMALAAFERGKHVLCEKPLAMNADEARRLYEEADKCKLVHMIDHEYRFYPGRVRMKELIDEGYLGQLYYVHSTSFFLAMSRPYHFLPESQGGGLLSAYGSHVIDALRCWFGEIVGVFGQLDTWMKQQTFPETQELRSIDVDDTFSFLARFENGASATVVASSAAHHATKIRSMSMFEAYGSHGTLKLGPDDKLMGGRSNDTELAEIPIPERLRLPSAKGYHLLPPFIRLAQEFIRGIREGKSVKPNFYDGIRHQQVMAAIRLSHEQARWISVPREARIGK